ncbi:MAG TPA: cbb3-type cytochrome c oxidase subunit I [Candidatus Limnocylindria bacterium]|nr:cbb3-type cytochrome c oxidase subunit I [Candidatus Limnocylindria bacterium]
MSANLKKLRPYDQPPRVREPLVPDAPDSAATLWLVVSVLWLLVAAGLGTLWIAELMFPAANLQLHFPLPFGLNIWVVIDAQRTASAFQNAVVYGWLANAGIGAIWFIVPRITGRSLVSNVGANVALGLWNLAVLLGLASIILGALPGTGPLAEFPLPIDALAALALLMVNGIFWATVAPSLGRGTYVSVLYFGIGLLAFLGLYTLESLVPLLNLGETPSALANAFFVRDLETYWLLGVAVGTIYYVIPRATGNPLHSSGLAMLGWLVWLVMALLSGLSRLLDPSIAYAVTTAGTAATIVLVLHALLVSANLFLSIRGRWAVALLPGAAAFALVAVFFLLTSSIIEAIGSLRSVQEVIAPTEWIDGAFIYAALGTYTFAALSLIDYAFPRLLRRAWGTNRLSVAEFWLVWAGSALAGSALMFGGLAQGSLLGQGVAADQIDATLLWFRLVAFGGIGLVALGALALVVDLFLMYTSGRLVTDAAAESVPVAGTATPTTASTSAL